MLSALLGRIASTTALPSWLSREDCILDCILPFIRPLFAQQPTQLHAAHTLPCQLLPAHPHSALRTPVAAPVANFRDHVLQSSFLARAGPAHFHLLATHFVSRAAGGPRHWQTPASLQAPQAPSRALQVEDASSGPRMANGRHILRYKVSYLTLISTRSA
jgi:hypothetical protein